VVQNVAHADYACTTVGASTYLEDRRPVLTLCLFADVDVVRQ
jgi:hypothetical protein